MQTYREELCLVAGIPASMPAESSAPPDISIALPFGWRQLPTRMRGGRLFRIMPCANGDSHWLAEMTINGAVLRRRCASELYARWWLSARQEPRHALADSARDELSESFRARTLTTGNNGGGTRPSR